MKTGLRIPALLLATGMAAVGLAGTPLGQGKGGPGKAGVARLPGVFPFRAPDGSQFLLMPRAGRGVVHWASYSRMGHKHEPPGWQGVSLACARSSLAGPWLPGTKDKDAEERALRTLDRAKLEYALARASRGGGEARKRAAQTLREAKALAASWGDPLAFQRQIVCLPASPIQVKTDIDGTLVTCTVPRAQLLSFASLMEKRRRSAVLRDFVWQLEKARAELRDDRAKERAKHGSEGLPLLTEACAQALLFHPLRSCLLAPIEDVDRITRAQALEFYRQHQAPDRSVTVILGDFDLRELRDGLSRIFVHAPAASMTRAKELPNEPDQSSRRSIRLVRKGKPRVLYAWRLPPKTPRGTLDVLARTLDAREGSLLRDAWIQKQGLAVELEVLARAPSEADPSFFSILAVGRNAADLARFRKGLDQVIAELAKNGPGTERSLKAILAFGREQRQKLEKPAQYAAFLARVAGIGGLDLVREFVPTVDAVKDLCARLFVDSRMTVVEAKLPEESEPPQKNAAEDADKAEHGKASDGKPSGKGK